MDDLLFLTQRIPYPPDKGDKIRAYNELRHLSNHYRVHLGCFYDDPRDKQHEANLRELCASTFCLALSKSVATLRGVHSILRGRSLSKGYFYDKRMAAWVRTTLSRMPSAKIFVYCSAMAPYILPFREREIVLDMVDVDSEKWRGYADRHSWPLRSIFAREQRALLALERQAALTFKRSLFVSKAEAEVFLRLAPECAGRVGDMSNGVDWEYFDPARDYENPFGGSSKSIVFTGTMNYPPNIEAVSWFVDNVFPRVQGAFPQAQFWIVGHNPTKSVRKLARHTSVRITGRVADVRPYLAHADCVVVPILLARGIQNKVLEAMAMAKAIVATPDACEGLDVCTNQEVLIARTAAKFGDAVNSVLSGAAAHLGPRARLRATSDYDWRNNLKTLDILLQNNAAGKPMEQPPTLRLTPTRLVVS